MSEDVIVPLRIRKANLEAALRPGDEVPVPCPSALLIRYEDGTYGLAVEPGTFPERAGPRFKRIVARAWGR